MFLEVLLIFWYFVVIEYDIESDDRDNDNVFVDNFNDIWEFCRYEFLYYVR